MTLLTVEEFKDRVSTNASDAAIEAVLAAAEESILAAAGPSGNGRERIRGGNDQIMLGRRAETVLAVIERVGSLRTELAPDDWELSPSGSSLRRLSEGANPSDWWRGQVEVIYTAFPGEETRKSVQAELAALDLGISIGSASGALTQERIGDYSQSFSSTAVAQTPEDRRSSILARLDQPILTFWVGSGHSSLAGEPGS